MTPLQFHQARLLVASIRRECKVARKQLDRIGESGYGDPAVTIANTAQRIGKFQSTLTAILKGRK